MTTIDRVQQVIRKAVPTIYGERGEDLWGAGMDSMASVSLMIQVEEEFSIRFPQELLTRQTFSNAGNIADAVDQILCES